MLFWLSFRLNLNYLSPNSLLSQGKAAYFGADEILDFLTYANIKSLASKYNEQKVECSCQHPMSKYD